MAFLFAILIATGRLAADSELVAMRASGISLWAIYRPILIMSLVLAALTGYLSTVTLPAGNKAISDLRLSILTRNVSQQVKPKVFYDQLQDRVLYVFETPRERRRLARGLPRRRRAGPGTAGDRGRDRPDQSEPGHRPGGPSVRRRRRPRGGHEQPGRLPAPATQGRQHRTRGQPLPARRAAGTGEGRPVHDSPRTLRTDRGAPEGPRRSGTGRWSRSHKKFAIPAACLVFGLYGIPLGFPEPAGAAALPVSLVSVGIFLFYYVLLGNGEEAAASGQLPSWLAMWAPNIVLSVLGTFLLWRRNRDKSLMISALDRFARDHLWRRFARLGRRRELLGRRRRAPGAPARARAGRSRWPPPLPRHA